MTMSFSELFCSIVDFSVGFWCHLCCFSRNLWFFPVTLVYEWLFLVSVPWLSSDCELLEIRNTYKLPASSLHSRCLVVYLTHARWLLITQHLHWMKHLWAWHAEVVGKKGYHQDCRLTNTATAKRSMCWKLNGRGRFVECCVGTQS